MPKQNTLERRRLNAVDYFLIIAAILCIAGAALRVVIGNAGGSLSSPVVQEDYIVSFKIENIRRTSTEYLTEGEEFYIESTKQYMGKITGSVATSPALFYVEDANGNYVLTDAPENGDASREDVHGTMLVSGYMSESGFLLGGSTPIAANKDLTLRSKNLSVKIIITDIAKAS